MKAFLDCGHVFSVKNWFWHWKKKKKKPTEFVTMHSFFQEKLEDEQKCFVLVCLLKFIYFICKTNQNLQGKVVGTEIWYQREQ